MIKTIYVCSSCGEQASKWSGKCLHCHLWNTLVEDAVDKETFSKLKAKTIEISKLSLEDAFAHRARTRIDEFDRVLGGGLIKGSFTLLTGDPGVGKSTLALQVALSLAHQQAPVLYISGEESIEQISLRARRLCPMDVPKEFSLISSQQFESILATIHDSRAEFVVADSVQTFHSDKVSGVSGSIVQVRHIAERLMAFAKDKSVSVLLIGHVNKEGNLAGPKVLEHLVDTVLFLEGERYQDLRMLRALKNRFGSTSELGVFSLEAEGMKEIRNPSEIFLNGRKKDSVGSALTVAIEGTRPFVLEVQGLTNPADYTYPKRTAQGVDTNRLQLLAAVLNKHLRLKLDQQDIYINIAGGFRVRDPALDLAIVSAIISSRRDIPLPNDIVVFGEVGLSGEVRPVSQESRRLKELEKLGFREVWGNITGSTKTALKIRPVEDIQSLSTLIKS